MTPARRGLAVLALAVTLLGAGPAAAADDSLHVSPDGVAFDRTMPGALFPAEFRVVPGDVRTENLWVRNTGPVTGRLQIQLVDAATTDPDLARALSLGVVAVDGRGRPTPRTIAEAGDCTIVNDGITLEPGETVALRAEATLADLDDRRAQGAVAAFGFRLVITDAAVPGEPGNACATGDDDVDVPGTPPGGDLAETGPEGVQPLALLAAGLIGAGLVLALVRRSARDDDA